MTVDNVEGATLLIGCNRTRSGFVWAWFSSAAATPCGNRSVTAMDVGEVDFVFELIFGESRFGD